MLHVQCGYIRDLLCNCYIHVYMMGEIHGSYIIHDTIYVWPQHDAQKLYRMLHYTFQPCKASSLAVCVCGGVYLLNKIRMNSAVHKHFLQNWPYTQAY